MPQLLTGRLTRGEILTRALRKAGNTAITLEAQTWLNQILYDLYTQYPSWPFLQTSVATDFLFPYNGLPADFIRAQDDEALAVTVLGTTPCYLIVPPVDLATFLRIRGAGTGYGTPQCYTLGFQFGTFSIWPVPQDNIGIAVLRYMKLPDDLTLDSDIPTFPWSDYLIQAVYVEALGYERDPRTDNERQIREMMLNKILNIANPRNSQSPVIPLDPLVFSRRTFDGWWQ